MASGAYTNFITQALLGAFDITTDDVKAALLDSSHTFNVDDDNWSDVSANEIVGTGYTAGGKVVTGMTVTSDDTSDLTKVDSDDITWSTSTITADHAVFKVEVGSVPLMVSYDFGGSVMSVNGDFTISPHADGLFQIAEALTYVGTFVDDSSGASSDYVDCGAALLPATGDFDMSMKIYPDTVDGTNRYFFGQYTAGVSGRTTLYYNSTKVDFFVGGASVSLTGGSVTASTWNTIRVTRVGNNWELFVNDSSVATATNSGSIMVSNDTTLGKIDYVGVTYFEGRMRDFVVNGVTAYAFDEGVGATLTDTIGSNDGTITNATTTAGAGFWANTL